MSGTAPTRVSHQLSLPQGDGGSLCGQMFSPCGYAIVTCSRERYPQVRDMLRLHGRPIPRRTSPAGYRAFRVPLPLVEGSTDQAQLETCTAYWRLHAALAGPVDGETFSDFTVYPAVHLIGRPADSGYYGITVIHRPEREGGYNHNYILAALSSPPCHSLSRTETRVLIARSITPAQVAQSLAEGNDRLVKRSSASAFRAILVDGDITTRWLPGHEPATIVQAGPAIADHHPLPSSVFVTGVNPDLSETSVRALLSALRITGAHSPKWVESADGATLIEARVGSVADFSPTPRQPSGPSQPLAL
jgi:hypothetical protein